MSENKQDSHSKKGWIKYLLIVSLGLNILVIGIVGGAVLRGGPPERVLRDREIGALGLRSYYRAMNADQQAALKALVAQSRETRKDGHQMFRNHMKAMAAALTAEPFELENVEKELKSQANVARENIGAGQMLLLQQIERLTKEERAAMADKLLHPRRSLRKRPAFKPRN